MKLIKYFEELVNTDDTNPKIIKLIKNFIPRIEVIINKTNKLQGIDVLKANLSKMYNYFSSNFFQKIKLDLDKLPDNQKGFIFDYIKKFNDTLQFFKNDIDSLLQNLKLDDDQISSENKKLLIQIFFSSFVLYKIIKEIEKITPGQKDFFENSYGILFSIFEKGDVYKSAIDEKSQDFFRKALGLIRKFNNSSFYKEIRKDNKEEDKKKELNKNVQRFYLKYIGDNKKFDFKYLCISPDERGSFLIADSTPYDLCFIESNANKYILDIDMLSSLLNSNLDDIKNKPILFENLKKIFIFNNEENLQTSNNIKVNNIQPIKIKLDDNKKIKKSELGPFILKCSLTFI